MGRILLVGEQFTSVATEIKGTTGYLAGGYTEQGSELMATLRSHGNEVEHFVSCRVPEFFPESMEALRRYDLICLSDIGADAFLLHPDMVKSGRPRPNRLRLLKEYVEGGGALLMIGGWMSFAGLEGKARYSGTAIEEILPVTCSSHDDRQEIPEGAHPRVVMPAHPVVKDVPGPWPFVLGYNRVSPKAGAAIVLAVADDPLLCVWDWKAGRTGAFMTDCAPHWAPPEFLGWKGYSVFWGNLARWLLRA